MERLLLFRLCFRQDRFDTFTIFVFNKDMSSVLIKCSRLVLAYSRVEFGLVLFCTNPETISTNRTIQNIRSIFEIFLILIDVLISLKKRNSSGFLIAIHIDG